MTREDEWRREWEGLRAERAEARREWRTAADGLSAWSRDPLGIGRLVRGHPVATAGIGAALGALVARFLRGKAPAEGATEERAEAPRPALAWTTVLRDAAVNLAVPWILRRVKEGFGPGPERNGEAP